ncbi:DUF7504 family protein [Halorubrum salsamenti]|uniref:DUF7504 family protein n=1 Tax=Halorubrum salsamenti TaxID=2583990 RepID=UPI001F4F30E4|nr:hypothetical protein [Halorubrum salsamenti]
MPVPTQSGREYAVRVSDRGRPSVRDGEVGEQVISLLFGTGIEEWRRGWRRTAGTLPDREAIVSASDLTRGAATATQVVPDRGLAYTVLGAPVDVEQILEAVTGHFVEARDLELTVIIDDIEPLLAEHGRDAVSEFLDELRVRLGDCQSTVVIGCSFTERTASSVASVFDPVHDVERIEHSVAAALERLRGEDPTTFGYVRRHWAEARTGIERCERNYPQAKQVHAVLSEPETTPRTLGTALSGLVSLGVLDTWSETVGPTRYDLTAYKPARMWAVGATLATAADLADGDDGSVDD